MSKIQTTWRTMRPAALAAALCGLGAVTGAQATLIISYTATAGALTNSVTCVDNNAACDTDPTVDRIVLANGTSPLPGLLVNGSTHYSTTAGGMNLISSGSSSIFWTGPGTVSLNVSVSDTDFIGPSFVVETTGSGTFTTAQGSTINLGWYNDPLNRQGADTSTDRPGNLVDSFAFIAPDASQSFSHNFSGPLAFPDLGPFSMTLGFDFTLISGGVLTSRGMTELKPVGKVPEPGTLALLGFGLAGLAFTRRRKHY